MDNCFNLYSLIISFHFFHKFDSSFERANPNIKIIEKISLSFLVAMRNFKKHCCVANITDSYKASTEECITGLRDQIKNETEENCLEVISWSCSYKDIMSCFRSIEF